MRVLLVEDSASLQRSVAEGLRRSGFVADVVGDGRQGLLYAQTSDYDALILDVMLPEIDGLTVLRRLREKRVKTPILLLTARDAVADRVEGLQLGADDYLVKPFSLAELIARTKALIRRSTGVTDPSISAGSLTINTASRTVQHGGVPVPLTPREYALLEYLAHHQGKPVSRAELEEHLYDQHSQVNSNAIDVSIYSLRTKLTAVGCPPMIRTRRGFGYVLVQEAP